MPTEAGRKPRISIPTLTGREPRSMRCKTVFLKASDPEYRKGAQYLLDTQFPDGSWYVRSRVVKLQPYFQSAFPFGHDQWISNPATAYAVIALAPIAGDREASR